MSDPTYAPLSTPVWTHIEQMTKPQITTPPQLSLDIQRVHVALHDAHRRALLTALAEARQWADALLPPVLDLSAVQTALTTAGIGEGVSLRMRLSGWRRSGILRPAVVREVPDRAMVTAVLIAWRLRGERERGWLPDQIPVEEPTWWCWRQDDPDGSPVACPVPLPSDLPAASRLWTPWGGAAHLAGWTAVPGGAARWAGEPTIGALTVWAAAGGADIQTMQHPALTILSHFPAY